MNWLSSINIVSGIVLLICLYLLYRYGKTKDEEIDVKKNLITIFYSICILFLAMVAYVLIREETLSINGVQGRDAILIPFGMALLIYSLLNLLRSRLRNIIYVIIIVLGISCFNLLYIEWQKDYYYQLSMENLLVDEIIKDNDTFFLIDLNESDVKGQRFYSLNANAYHVYNDETRLFIPKVSNLYLLEDENALRHTIEALDYANMMKDYNPEDYYFDAIIVYENNLSDLETLKLKYAELTDYSRFIEQIRSKGTLKVYLVDDDFTELLIKEYKNKKITDDEGVLKLLEEYRNK